MTNLFIITILAKIEDLAKEQNISFRCDAYEFHIIISRKLR